MKRQWLALCILSCLGATAPTGCAPAAKEQQIKVYTDDLQIGGDFEVIGDVIYQHSSGLAGDAEVREYNDQVLDRTIPALKEKARQMGANAIIIDGCSRVNSLAMSGGIRVKARAIRVESNEEDR